MKHRINTAGKDIQKAHYLITSKALAKIPFNPVLFVTPYILYMFLYL